MPTLNERAWELCDAMVADAEQLGITVQSMACGTRLIDCGVKVVGSMEAGLQLANVCMSGLGEAIILGDSKSDSPELQIQTGTSSPVAACMASQYAGWEIKGEKFFAMGSGPMRAAACREELFQHIGHCELPEVCVGVLETGKLPPDAVCMDIAEKCGMPADRLTLLVARTASQAGTVQIVARSVETALHKLHLLGFDLRRIKAAEGFAPLPPIANDDLTAIGWTNDAILYGTWVALWVNGDDESINEVGPRVPSSASVDYGRPFGEIFKRYGGDFYRIDPMLFSPAKVTFTNEDTDLFADFGHRAPEVLAQSFAKK
jgi:methenyltetrahydromethanopterin cyclohydrolase